MKTLTLLQPGRKTCDGLVSSLWLLPSVSPGVPPKPFERTWLICGMTSLSFSPPRGSSFFPSLPPSVLPPSSVTSHSVSCGIREMIKEDSFKYLSSLSLMASQSRWAWSWQEESVEMTGRDWGGGKYLSVCVLMCVYLFKFIYISTTCCCVCVWRDKKETRRSLAFWAPVAEYPLNRYYTSHWHTYRVPLCGVAGRVHICVSICAFVCVRMGPCEGEIMRSGSAEAWSWSPEALDSFQRETSEQSECETEHLRQKHKPGLM